MTGACTSETSGTAWVVKAAVVAAVLLSARVAAAQAPVRSFDQLDTRLKAGDTVWVTDAQGHYVKGKVAGVGEKSLTLNGGREGRTFVADDVRIVELKRHENLAGGTLVGLGVGLGLGAIAIASAGCSGDVGGCLFATLMLGGMGAGIGCGVDALIPENRRDVIYRAPAATTGARFSVRPTFTSRGKGVLVSFAF